MKKLCLLAVFLMSSGAFADYCSDNHNQMEASEIGTIVFDKTSECQEAYKITKDCSIENVRLYEESPLNPRMDCSSPLKDYIISHNNKILVKKPN